MKTQPGGPAVDGDISLSTRKQIKTLEPLIILKNFVENAQLRITRAFTRQDNINFLEHHDTKQ